MDIPSSSAIGTLYVSYKPKGKPPSWTDLMRGGVADDFLDGLKARSVSAVMLVEQHSRKLDSTGRTAIEQSGIEIPISQQVIAGTLVRAQ